MDISRYKKKVKKMVVQPMLQFIDEWEDSGYTKDDVNACEELMYHYIDALGAMSHPENLEIMEQVKELVLALNELNEATDYELIETDMREAIWEIIQTSAIDCGLKNAPDDVTEEWRDW